MPRKVPKLPVQTVRRGDDWFLAVSLKTRTGPNTWVPADLSEWTFTAAWTPYADNVEDRIMLTVDVTLPNKLLVHATPAQTVQMYEWNDGIFDVQGVRPGETKTFFEGTTVREADVTP